MEGTVVVFWNNPQQLGFAIAMVNVSQMNL